MGTNAHYLDLVRVNTPTIGTGGSLTIGAAVTGCLDFITGGAVDGTLYRYSILDGTASSEIGLATYNAGLGALTGRTVTKSTNNNNPLNLSGTAQILICLAAEDTNITLGSSVMSLGGSYGTIGGPISWSGLQTLAGGYTLPTIPLNSVLYSGGSGASVSGTLNSLGTIKFLTQINGSGPIWSDLPGTFAGFANPTGSIGLIAVNGTSAFAMRADGHPPIDQGIIPVWTGLHTFNAGINANFGSFSGSVTGANFNGISGFANPTGSIGLTAVNGTSAFATRADGHSGIDQSITPTWTNIHKWSVPTNTTAILVTGTVLGARFVPSPTSFIIEGVDPTGLTTYQPITVGGSVVNLSLFGSIVSIMNPTGFVPAITNTYSLGSPSLVWANVYATTGSFTNIITPGGSFSGLANPTGSIGLSAVNGTSAFATRSDGHPALSQAIAPVWTNSHIWINAATIGWQNSTGSLVGGSVGSQIFKYSDNNLYLESYDIGSNFIFRGNLATIYLTMGSAAQASFNLLVVSSGPNAGLQFQDRAGGTAVSWAWYSQSGIGRFFNNIGGDSIWVSTGGSVSIGAATPIAQFNVTGQGQATTSFITSGGSLGATIFLNDTGASSGYGGAVLFGAGSGAWRFAAIKGFVTDGSSNSSGDLVFSTRFINSDSVLTEAIVIKGANGTATAGAVGIGTTAPLSRLDVGGGVAIGSYAGVNQAPANGLIVSGPVGIGTPSPFSAAGVLTVSSFIVVPVIVGGTATNSTLDLRTTINGTASGDIFAIRGSEIAFTTIPGTIYGIMTVTGLYLGNGTPINRLDVSGGAAIGSYAGTLAPTNGLIVSGSVGLGTSAPDSTFTLSLNTGTSAAPILGTVFHIIGGNSAQTRLLLDAYSVGGQLVGRRANGSIGSPAFLTANNNIIGLNAFGYDGATGYTGTASAALFLGTAEDWIDGSHHGTYFQFQTTQIGTGNLGTKMSLYSGLYIGTATGADPGIGNIFVANQLGVAGSNGSALFTATNTGQLLAYGAFHQLGTASNLNTNIIIQSGTGGGAGAGVFIQNGAGNNVMAFGNYSAIFGGVYNSTAVVYSSGPMLFQGSSFSFQAGPITLGSYTTPGTLGVTTGTGLVIAGGFVTPQMFGCAVDGVTDDTIPFGNCLNSGKPILLVGSLLITGPIVVNTGVGQTIQGIFVQGAGQQLSQIICNGSNATITINCTYGNGNTVSSNPQFVLKDFAIVMAFAGIGSQGSFNLTTGTGQTGTFKGVLNLIGLPATGQSMIGVGNSIGDVSNLTFLSNGTGWAFNPLYCQDLRYTSFNHVNISSGVGAATESISQGYGLVFKATYQPLGNAPTIVRFNDCQVIGGIMGGLVLPSGAPNFDCTGVTFTTGSANITKAGGGLPTLVGTQVTVSGASVPLPFVTGHTYYVVSANAGGTIIQLSGTSGGSAITVTGVTSATNIILSNPMDTEGMYFTNCTFIGCGINALALYGSDATSNIYYVTGCTFSTINNTTGSTTNGVYSYGVGGPQYNGNNFENTSGNTGQTFNGINHTWSATINGFGAKGSMCFNLAFPPAGVTENTISITGGATTIYNVGNFP